jgi:hypothetical protein
MGFVFRRLPRLHARRFGAKMAGPWGSLKPALVEIGATKSSPPRRLVIDQGNERGRSEFSCFARAGFAAEECREITQSRYYFRYFGKSHSLLGSKLGAGRSDTRMRIESIDGRFFNFALVCISAKKLRRTGRRPDWPWRAVTRN